MPSQKMKKLKTKIKHISKNISIEKSSVNEDYLKESTKEGEHVIIESQNSHQCDENKNRFAQFMTTTFQSDDIKHMFDVVAFPISINLSKVRNKTLTNAPSEEQKSLFK